MPKEKVKKRAKQENKRILLCRFYHQLNFWMGMPEQLIDSTEVPLILKFDNQNFYFYPSKIKTICYKPINYINYNSGLDSYYQLKIIEAYSKITTQENISNQATLLSLKKDFLLSKFKELKNSLNQDDDFHKEFERKFFIFKRYLIDLRRKIYNYNFKMNVQERDNEDGQKLRNDIEEGIVIVNGSFDILNNEIENLIIMKQQKNEALHEKITTDREINNLRQDQPSTSAAMNLDDELLPYLVREEHHKVKKSSWSYDELLPYLVREEHHKVKKSSWSYDELLPYLSKKEPIMDGKNPDFDDELWPYLAKEEPIMDGKKPNFDDELWQYLVSEEQESKIVNPTSQTIEDDSLENIISQPVEPNSDLENYNLLDDFDEKLLDSKDFDFER